MTRTRATGSSGYLALVRQCPRLSREREHELVLRWREHGDASTRDLLIRSQLRSVVAIARHYRHEACATFDELIAEGNFGLIQALAKFDPDQGTRFVTYAVYWIRAYISQHLTRSRSLVASGVQSKLPGRIVLVANIQHGLHLSRDSTHRARSRRNVSVRHGGVQKSRT